MTHKQTRAIFDKATSLPPSERQGYIASLDLSTEIRKELKELLEHHERAETYLDVPAAIKYQNLFGIDVTQIAEFELIREIGRGGMGTVYLAEDSILARKVAVKVLAPHLSVSESSVLRFKHEAKAIAALNHDEIVPIYRYGQDQDLHYIVMEYVDGPTLASEIARSFHTNTISPTTRTSNRTPDHADQNEPSSPQGERTALRSKRAQHRRFAKMIGRIADALEHAHRRGVIHRDVKPSNILIDTDNRPRLTDFGIAKYATDMALTKTGDIAGTAYYMSPEQALQSSATIDHRTDIFSLGVVLYECLSGRRPFEGGTTLQVLDAIRVHDPARLRTLSKDIPRDLETICHKAIEKNATDRYQSAGQIAADLRSWLNGNPILARPPSMHRKIRRWTAQNRSRTMLMSLITLLTVSLALTLALHSARQESMAWVQVDCPSSSLRLELRRADPETLEYTEPINRTLSRGSNTIRLEPGLYRVKIIFPDFDLTKFSETDLWLNKAGSDSKWSLVVGGDGSSFVHNARTRFIPYPSVLEKHLPDAQMALIPAGIYARGSGDDNTPFCTVRDLPLDAFLIDQTEVSNKEYYQFLLETAPDQDFRAYLQSIMGLRGPAIEERIQDLGGLIGPEGLPELVDWIDGLGADDWVIRDGYPPSPLVPKYWHQIGYDPATEDHPVVGIPVEAMHAYASWYGKRLPTWTEWDATARGTQGDEYPQGLDLSTFQSLDPDIYLLTTLESPEHLTRYAIYRFASHPVDEHDPFATAQGVMHLFGNASEMVSTVAQRRGNIVIKGRNWQNGTRYNKLSFTATGNYSGFYYTEGFRCAKSN